MKTISKKGTERRVVTVLIAFGIFASYLLVNIFKLSYINFDYYKQKTYDQVTTSSSLRAKRGNIYDSNMNVLAESTTQWRVFVSTRDIKAKSKTDGKDYNRIISDAIASPLSLNKDSLYKKLSSSNVLDVTLKKQCSEEEYKAVLEVIKKEKLEDVVFTEATTTREYPENTLAAHVLGFTGSDSQGLFGLEYFYDDILSGEDGYYVYAKDANGKALDTEYSSYFPATDGYSIVTTIDTYIQSELEAVIEKARINHSAENRVCGIVMDTKTGAILAMATTSPFDPNSPFELDEISEQKLKNSGLKEDSAEYKAYKNELLQVMWSNKAVSETYEPGSTFKIVTVSAALDTGAADVSDTFSCKGYKEVGGWKIKCHKTTGHGSGFSLAYGLQMSCNPCMMSLSERLGANAFYNYVEKFGYLEKTGIDLPGEATTIFHKESAIGATELATASFGQRFKVSIINQLTAISAVANGGNLVTPYLVEKVIDSEGNIISKHETEVKRKVISKETAKTVSDILIEGVSGNGGAKNAGVSGYDIAAKTGTSQKFDILDENGNSYLRIGSTVAYSTNLESGVSAIIVVDEPTSTVKYGSVVAAPYISELFEKILPYLDFKSTEEIPNITVSNYVGQNIKTVEKKLTSENISYETVGNGDTVIKQIPDSGDVITYPLSKIILYTEKAEEETVEVPSLIGSTFVDGIKKLINSGLNVKISGNTSSQNQKSDIISYQSIPQGTKVRRGTVVTIRAITTSFND